MYLPLESSSVGQPPVSSRHHQFKALSTHIYLALAITVVLTALRLIKTRLSKSQSALPLAASIDVKETKFSHHNLSTSSPTSCHSKRLSSLSSLWPWPSSEQGVGSDRVRGSHLQHSAWAATVPLPFSARTGKLSPFGQSLAMDGSDGDPRKDRSGSASRGVSTKVPGRAGSRRQQNPSPAGTNAAGQIVWGTEDSNSPHFSSWNPFEGHDSSGSDEKGKYPMSAQTSHFGSTAWGMDQQAGPSGATYGDELLGSASGPVQGRDFADIDFTTPRHFSRPPPPPPFAQPTFSDTMYRFEDRRPSYAVSIPPELDANFLHHPNPEYAGASTSSDVLSSSPQSTSPIPRRRSYTRSIPMGIPIPTSTSASFADSMTSTSTFSPSSYPPTSPLLPPPPPGHDAPPEYVFVGGPGGPGVLLEEREIDLHGEIVSVMDHTGHGWKRHTRVYGGGVCLACLAAEDQGGFYGDKVPLSDRR